MNNTNKALLIGLSFGSAASLFWIAHFWYCHLDTTLKTTITTPIVWSEKISQSTRDHSWATWRDFYNTVKTVSREEFDKAIEQGEYKLLSIEEFLDLHVENHRLNEYRNAKTAEEFYPVENRPRGDSDIKSINYHVSLQSPMSPICVAKVMISGTVRYIKLDGVHRLIAASIRKSPVKVLFINL